jgi:hypothetical protein
LKLQLATIKGEEICLVQKGLQRDATIQGAQWQTANASCRPKMSLNRQTQVSNSRERWRKKMNVNHLIVARGEHEMGGQRRPFTNASVFAFLRICGHAITVRHLAAVQARRRNAGNARAKQLMFHDAIQMRHENQQSKQDVRNF